MNKFVKDRHDALVSAVVDDDGAYICSCCKVGNWGADPAIDKYCFNCGAQMNGGSEE